MIKVVFVDGSEEMFESDDGNYCYNKQDAMFKILVNKSLVMIPREFVRFIQVLSK